MMDNQRRTDVRQQLLELTDRPVTRQFVIGYLLGCLDERHWPALVQAALEFTERVEELQTANGERLAQLLLERYR